MLYVFLYILTGCSSGFGFELALKLDALGFQVFAGCRITDDERARSLKNRCSNKLKVLKLDVTKDDEVDFALFQLEKMLNGNRKCQILIFTFRNSYFKTKIPHFN